MTMRKKDYEAIARAIKLSMDATTATGQAAFLLTLTANRIADRCATQDPTFKRERFLADCGVSHD